MTIGRTGEAPPEVGWVTAVVVAAVVALVVTPAAVLTVPVGLAVGIGLAEGAPVYGALALAVILVVRLRSRHRTVDDLAARRFRTARQRLHLTVVIAAVAAFAPGAIVLVSDAREGATLARGSIWFAHPDRAGPRADRHRPVVGDEPRTAAAERRTLRARSPGHRLVRLNRLLSWVVWLAGIGLGVLFWAVGP